jgi:hypothetical protein
VQDVSVQDFSVQDVSVHGCFGARIFRCKDVSVQRIFRCKDVSVYLLGSNITCIYRGNSVNVCNEKSSPSGNKNLKFLVFFILLDGQLSI